MATAIDLTVDTATHPEPPRNASGTRRMPGPNSQTLNGSLDRPQTRVPEPRRSSIPDHRLAVMSRGLEQGGRQLAHRCQMRFRRNERDVAMPAALIASWTAWNEIDLGQVRGHLEQAVTDSVVRNDPRDCFVGIDELEAAVLSSVGHPGRARWDRITSIFLA